MVDWWAAGWSFLFLGGVLESLSEEVAFKLRSEGYEGPSRAQAEGLAGAEASGRKSVLRSRRKPA